MWAMNHDIDVQVALQRTGIVPLDFVDENLRLTPSQVRSVWHELSKAAEKRNFERIGLQTVLSLPFDMFRDNSEPTNYPGMDSLLYSNSVSQALQRYAAAFENNNKGASIRIAVHEDHVSVVWNLGSGNTGPHHTDFCVAVVVATLTEALGERLPVLRVGLGSDEHLDVTSALFGAAELIASESMPFLELTRKTYELPLGDNYPYVGESLDRRLGRVIED